MTLFLITVVVVAVLMAIMAIGVILTGRCLVGSCGGEAIYGPDGELLNCRYCPVRKEQESSLG